MTHKLTDTRTPYHTGKPTEPPANATPAGDDIILNRTFADGSRLEIRATGGEAIRFYCDWLWPVLEREAD